MLVLLSGILLVLVPTARPANRRALAALRREAPRARRRTPQTDGFVPLPVRLELVGAMLAGGLSMPRALATVAETDSDPWLARVADGLAVGLAWETAWDRVLGHKPPPAGWAAALPRLAGLARRHREEDAPSVPEPHRTELVGLRDALGFAVATGAPAAALLRAQAARARKHRHRAAEQRAASLGVRLMLPLGLCSLPAFVCLGIVPVLIGLLPDLW